MPKSLLTRLGVVAAALLSLAITASLTSYAGAADAGRTAGSVSTGLTTSTAIMAGSIVTGNRASVRAAYRSQFRPALSTPIGFTGNTRTCLAGAPSARSQTAVLNALNFARGLNHLDPVRFSPRLDADAQQAALMMAANQTLSHSPPRSWKCWTAVGAAAAARSNLAIRWPRLNSGQVARMYLSDTGAMNDTVGHRRWVLNPPATVMGSGSTSTTNALIIRGPTSSKQRNPAYTSWPSKGWFPRQLEPAGRWSLSSGKNANFHHASVRVTRLGNHPRQLAVRAFPVADGYAKTAIVWQMPRGFKRSGTFKVTVSGIRNGGHQSTHSYVVRLFRA